jgi:transcriptional regulator of heat shock response
VPVHELSLGQLTERLNNFLRGKGLTDVNYEELRSVFLEFVNFPQDLATTIQDFFASMASGKDRLQFSSALQLVLQPEFADTHALSPVVAAVDNRDRFISMLRTQLNDRQVQTIIGSENLDPALHEVSLVFSKFGAGSDQQGTLGVLGPTRQLYSRTLPWVRLVGEAVAQVYRELSRRELED